MWFFFLFFLAIGPVCAGIAFLTVVRPLRLGRAARVSLGVGLLACSLKFTWFGVFGGHVFLPELPSGMIHALSVVYDFVLVLAAVGVTWASGRWVVRRARRVRPPEGADLSRRRMITGALACVAAGVGAKGVHDGVRLPDVVEVELAFPDLPPAFDGYRIAHLSDLHVSAAARADRTAGVVRLVNECQPDLIAITGDFVDGTADRRGADVAPLADLHAPDGVVGCTGNHEAYWEWPAWWDRFHRWKVDILSEGAPRVIRRGGDALAVGGLTDPAFRGHRAPPSPARYAFADAPANAFRILLFHRPLTAEIGAAAADVRLQLSGHTHGGAFPVIHWLVARANEGHVRGLYEFAQGRFLYNSPGTGQWAGFPLRLFNPAEITEITLRRRRRDA